MVKSSDSSERVLNWGLLSTARINSAMIPPLRASTRNHLAGVASRSIDRAREYAHEWDIPNAYGSYEEMLADPAIDAVYNSLPNYLHAEWTIKAAQAGKHVLCEKPLALTVNEVDAIRTAARQNGVVVAEAFMYQHHPLNIRVLEMVRAGEIGRLVYMRGSFSFSLKDPKDIRWKPEWGGGSIWDLGCYPVSYSLMLAGRAPEEVFGWQITAPSGVDLTFTGQMRFSDDVLAQFDSSFGLPYRVEMEADGTDGSIFFPSPFKPEPQLKPRIVKGEKDQIISAPNLKLLYSGEVEDLASAVLDGTPQRVSLEQSRLHIATLSALVESARIGKPVRL